MSTEEMRMTNGRAVATLIFGGAMAFGCRAPSSVSSVGGGSAAAASSLDWSSPRVGRSHQLLPTPKTVAWGWYDAAGEPVLRVASGDEITVRALSTCSPAALRNAGLDTNRIERESKE